MAISKTQNERPAIVDLIDTVNAMGDVGGQFDTLDRAMDAVDEFMARFKIGQTETITVPANDSYASSYVFDVPFTNGDGCMVILQVITDELSTLFEVALIDCTYSGFSYQITNSDADPHDVKLGFVAVRTNSD